ncbi:hypothetical protein BDN72DRAFT_487662 [Pluteus cervinus]|uniref:Uncharacterized protein n=1 Tax=Pluteus cervinus TaxID=181527 RepID=A0ACD3AZA4_9AGAR|nr:hypothetical protein BDN72DRAFT_487662 [Pluteus cervinus]
MIATPHIIISRGAPFFHTYAHVLWYTYALNMLGYNTVRLRFHCQSAQFLLQSEHDCYTNLRDKYRCKIQSDVYLPCMSNCNWRFSWVCNRYRTPKSKKRSRNAQDFIRVIMVVPCLAKSPFCVSTQVTAGKII